MRQQLKIALLFTAFILPGRFTFADGILDSEQALHATAHIGASYLLTHAGSSVCNLVTAKKHKTLCLLSGVILAAGAGVTKEVVIDKGESSNRHMVGYAQDLTGIGAAVTFVNFSW